MHMQKKPIILKVNKQDILIRVTRYVEFLKRKGIKPKEMQSEVGEWSSKNELLRHTAFLLKRMDEKFINKKGIQFAWGNFCYLQGILYATKTMSAREQARLE
jgi:hypothetical protein